MFDPSIFMSQIFRLIQYLLWVSVYLLYLFFVDCFGYMFYCFDCFTIFMSVLFIPDYTGFILVEGRTLTCYCLIKMHVIWTLMENCILGNHTTSVLILYFNIKKAALVYVSHWMIDYWLLNVQYQIVPAFSSQ